MPKKQLQIFDIELIGKQKPVMLVCTRNLTTGEDKSYWAHKPNDIEQLTTEVNRTDLLWIGFNSTKFDLPVLTALIYGKSLQWIKWFANEVIANELQWWQSIKILAIDVLNIDHIDLYDVAPGVQISLKTYMGRIHAQSLIDLPFEHDQDLTEDQLPTLEHYCFNDISGTAELFNKLRDELRLRYEMSAQYDVDLRSKSDAQIAEAVIRKRLDIRYKIENVPPSHVKYKTPNLIQTDSTVIQDLIQKLEVENFIINPITGSPIVPEWLAEHPIQLGFGAYQVRLGGLHSTHDINLHMEAGCGYELSDFDVASYYPRLILRCGFVPKLSGADGSLFLQEFRELFDRRILAKRSGDKKTAESLKIVLNSTFGKLGSIYSAFYAPDLMLGVTLTGQLNLLCLVYELEKIPNVLVLSANTDGLLVYYPKTERDQVLAVFATNNQRTGFEYEETKYLKIAMRDVNSYVAITLDGKVKTKGFYGATGLQKNCNSQVCANACVSYLKDGVLPEEFIYNATDFRDFLVIRNVRGGGVQHTDTVMVDDWVEIGDRLWKSPIAGKTAKRKSRPAPVQIGINGAPFGRLARWYYSTTPLLQPITYVTTGNRVPDTNGVQLCMTLPSNIPDDLDRERYIDVAYEMLNGAGVAIKRGI